MRPSYFISPKNLFVMALFCLFSANSQAQFLLDLETGAVFNSRYNRIRVPGEGGTQFDLAKEFNTDPAFFYRIRVGYTFGKRHTVSALYAPLQVKSTGAPGRNIQFYGANFQFDRPLEVNYQFNSYRLTYRYDFIQNEKLTLGVGLTGKIRDAFIELKNNQAEAKKANVGFVPLINFYLAWDFTDRFRLILDGDALAASQGRAEDVFLGLGYKLSDNFALKAGYRLLEGGADNDEVYNFTWYDYASVGAVIRF